MRKKWTVALAVAMVLTGCSGSSDAPETTAATSTEAEVTTAAPETTTEAATTPEETTEEEIWETTTPEKIRNAVSEEEQEKAREALTDQGKLLFEGKQDEGFYPSDIAWLQGAQKTDVITYEYTCDDLSHSGWGVIGLSVGGKQTEVKAAADQPDKPRWQTVTVEELCQQAKVDSPADIEKFALGAWNGGHIHRFFFLEGDVATEYQAFLTKLEEDKALIHSYDGSLSNPNAIPEAVAVYDYLKSVYADDNSCLTGQMESTWKGTADYEMNYIMDKTGKVPAIRGLDFMHNDFAGVTNRAKAWWEKGGIVTICWHTGCDFSSAYNESKDQNLDWDNAFVVGSDTYNKLLADMDRAVPYLQQLEDAGVPVLWRPFHELDGGWFWWTRGGSENFVQLWQLMYSRYVDYWGLDNLIWVLGYSHNGGDLSAWYPGDNYVDIVGGDSYDRGANKSLYEDVETVQPEGMPICFHECGTIPTEKQMKDAETPWLYFMVWHTDYITSESNNKVDSLKEIYNSDYFITLDELPSFVK